MPTRDDVAAAARRLETYAHREESLEPAGMTQCGRDMVVCARYALACAEAETVDTAEKCPACGKVNAYVIHMNEQGRRCEELKTIRLELIARPEVKP